MFVKVLNIPSQYDLYAFQFLFIPLSRNLFSLINFTRDLLFYQELLNYHRQIHIREN